MQVKSGEYARIKMERAEVQYGSMIVARSECQLQAPEPWK
jgi:hypothetical protein